MVRPQVSPVVSSNQVKTVGLLAVVLAILFVVYLPTLLTIVNGSPDSYAEDVAEIQTALNLWGTIHATGYPLYAMTGAAFVAVMRALGMNPAAAPCLYSTVWGFVALSIFYALLVKLTGRMGVAAVATLLLGLTRGVWAYSVLAKPYTMTLAFCVLLLAIAVWPDVPARRRFLLLALVSGFAVAHHRMIGFMGLGLLIATLPALIHEGGRWTIQTLLAAIPIALIGFLPYLYLPARAFANAVWVYGDPRTAQGFWNEFTAVEANHLFHLPATAEQWIADARDTVEILFSQMSPVGAMMSVLVVGIYLTPASPIPAFPSIGEGASLRIRRGGVRAAQNRYAARIGMLCAAGFVVFVLALHRVVMPTAVVMPVVMLLMFAVALAVSDLLNRWPRLKWVVPTIAGVGTAALLALSFGYIYTITHDDAGLKMIALAKSIPDGSVFMLPWSTSYNDVAFSKYVTGENADLPIADHTVNFTALRDQGWQIYTTSDTFYRFPLSWWDTSGKAYLSNYGNGLIGIHNTPTYEVGGMQIKSLVAYGIIISDYELSCQNSRLLLHVYWGATHKPDRDLSVFVHLIGNGAADVLATGDEKSPIYGWYPTTRWEENEIVSDEYAVPYLLNATAVQFGMYEQTATGQFVNYGTTTVPLKDGQGCSKN